MVVKYRDYKYFYILVIAIILTLISWMYLFNLIQKPEVPVNRITVIGNSMYPTFKNGDEVKFISSFSKEDIKNGTIVIFSAPEDPKTFSIKRVVGVEGNLVEIKDNILYLDREEVKVAKNDNNSFYYINDMSKRIGIDEVFVIGDNYNNSKDSRNYGSILISSIMGIVKE